MRLILVKPTNATRRLDLTGEVYRDGDLEHNPSGDPSTLTKSPQKKQQTSITSADASVRAQETSLCCESPSPNDRPNGMSPPKVSAHTMPRNLTFSQLSDQDWLLLCGQVNSIEDDSPSPVSAVNCVQHPNRSDARGCSCLDPKHFPQRAQATRPCLEPSHRQGLSNPAEKTPMDGYTFKEVESQKGSLPKCNRSKPQEGIPDASLFNIPFNSTECSGPTRELLQNSHSVNVDFNWRELFGKQPLLVQQRQKPHCSVSGNPSSESSGDPSLVLNSRHLMYDHSASTQRKLLPVASESNEQPFDISQRGSLENQGLVAEESRQRPEKVKY